MREATIKTSRRGFLSFGIPAAGAIPVLGNIVTFFWSEDGEGGKKATPLKLPGTTTTWETAS
jgi:hypothetical protein